MLWSSILLGSFVCLASIGLARRNLRRGRADVRGAWRLAAVGLGSLLLAHLARAHHVPALFEEFHLLERATAQAVLGAVAMAALYLALEPVVRRRWPRALTSWHRLLRGRVRDPMVGRDVLVGSLAGMSVLFLGIYARRSGGDLALAGHLRQLVYRVFAIPVSAVLWSMGLLLGIVLLHALVRRRWLAAALAGLPFFFIALGPSGAWSPLHAGAAAAATAVAMLVLVRFGLLAMAAAWFVMLLVDALPPARDLSAWYTGPSVAGALLLSGLVVFAFFTSLGGKPIFGAALDD